MKERWLALASALLLAACRTIVGIDDLEPFRPNNPNNGRDGGGPDGGGPDGGGNDNDGGACSARSDCTQCCNDQFPEARATFENGEGKRCVCEPLPTPSCGGAIGRCRGACLPDAGPVGRDGADCSKCVDEVLGSESKAGCTDPKCNGDPRCLDGLACLRSCRRP